MDNSKTEKRRGWAAGPIGMMLLLAVCGVALNYLGLSINRALGSPLYFDTLGTILAAALGGSIPGILAGLLTNLLNGFSDTVNIYYASVNALIAVAAAYFAGKGWWKSLWRTLLLVPVLAFLGGVVGGIMTWCLFGMSFDPGVPLAVYFCERVGLSPFWAQILAGFVIDLGDKAIITLVVWAALRFIPAWVKQALFFEGWRQTPLTSAEKRQALSSTRRRESLRVTLLALIAAAMLTEAVGSVAICGILYHRALLGDQTEMAVGVARLVASTIDPDRVDDYLALGEEAPGYLETERGLQAIRTGSDTIEYIYVYRILPDGCHVVFDLDTDELEGSPPGTVVEFDESFSEYVPTLLAGGEIEPLVTDDTYGWLLTAYAPVYDADGVCQCYAAVDVSMDRLTVGEVSFISRETSLFIGIILTILYIGVWLADYRIILPINTMTSAAKSFAYDSEEARLGSVRRFEALDIRTGDEIENLYRAVEKTMADTLRYAESVREQGETIANMQNGLILVLADMVESRDKCTGDHVRKTAAYSALILRHMRALGIYADQVDDLFCEDMVHSAPLHDVGKIQVSDVILNKPGKLTDEEFAIMKTHTTAGREIIDRAIETVGGATGYLNEARNLAAYHHERWDGGGYPEGLAGEEIPLSARIMAVADVFDALVSQRSYKPAFEVEKAMDIIREGAGTQFDAEIVRAFLDAEDEAREIAKKHLGP